MPIDVTAKVHRTPGLMATPIDNELVILSMQSNSYVSLDQVGRRIWDAIEDPITVQELCAQLASEYSSEAGTINADVMAFLDKLEADGLVQVTSVSDES